MQTIKKNRLRSEVSCVSEQGRVAVHQRQQQVHAKRAGIWAIAGIAGCYLICDPQFPQFRSFPSFTFGLCLFVFGLFVHTRNPKHLPIFVVSFLTWIYFCAPFLYSEFPRWDIRRIFPQEHFSQLAIFPAFSVAALVIGYYFSPVTGKPFFQPASRLNIVALQRLSITLSVLGTAFFILKTSVPGVLNSLGRTIAITENFTLFGVILAILCYFRRGLTPAVAFCSGVALLLQIFVIVSSTLFAKVAFILASLLLAIVLERRRLPIFLMISMFIIAFPIFSNRMSHRFEEGSGYENASSYSTAEKVGKAFETIMEDYSTFKWDAIFESTDDVLSSRLEDVTFLGHCIYLHEETGKAFKHGETMVGLAYSFIPRFIFPWKLKQDQGDVLATEYGFKDPGPEVSINFPWLADLYINFGFIGMVVGSLLFGAFLRWSCSIAAYGIGDLNLLMFCDLLWWQVSVENNVSMVMGGILQSLIIWWLIKAFVIPKMGLLPARHQVDRGSRS